jgi:recombination protein RecA
VSAWDDALAKVERSYGKGSIMRLGDDARVAVEAISSQSIALDRALGIGGFPRGRIVEVFGPESSGKTTLLLHLFAEAQRRELGKVAMIDAEHALDPTYAKAIGVNVDDLYVSQPDYGEQALNIAEDLIESGEAAIVAVDSVAALTPKAELDGEMGD